MNKIRKEYQKIGVFIEAYRMHWSASKAIRGDEKYMLIAFFGMIGDAVLFLNAYRFYQKYCENTGLKLVLVARKQVIDLYQTLGESGDTEFIEVERNTIRSDRMAFRDTVKKISQHHYKYILHVRARQAIEDCFLYAIPGDIKVVMRNNQVKPQSFIKRYFYDHTFNRTIYADENSDQYGRYGKMIKELFEPGFLSAIGKIRRSKIEDKIQRKGISIDMTEKYAVVSAGASQERKCWPIDRFAEVIKMLVEELEMNVCLVGSLTDSVISKKIMEIRGGGYSNHVFDATGKTTTQEWIELIRNASIVVTNDSASVHIAAAVDTPSVCVSPQHDGYRFLPYAPDLVHQGDCLPVPVRCKKLDCFDCQLNNRESEAQSNSLCRKSIQENGVIKCIYDITTEEVCEAVRAVLQ